MGDEGDEGDEGGHPGESHPRLREIGGDLGRCLLSGPHLGGVAPNGYRTIIRARDLVSPYADTRARAVANLADLGATCPN